MLEVIKKVYMWQQLCRVSIKKKRNKFLAKGVYDLLVQSYDKQYDKSY